METRDTHRSNLNEKRQSKADPIINPAGRQTRVTFFIRHCNQFITSFFLNPFLKLTMTDAFGVVLRLFVKENVAAFMLQKQLIELEAVRNVLQARKSIVVLKNNRIW